MWRAFQFVFLHTWTGCHSSPVKYSFTFIFFFFFSPLLKKMSDRLLLFMIGSVKKKKVSWRNYLSSSFIHTDKFTCDCAFSKIFPLNLHSRVQRLRRRRGFSSLQSSAALGKAFLFGARYLLNISGETVMKGASPCIRSLVIRAAAPFKWNWTITSLAARLACLCHVENRGLRLELSITGEGGRGRGRVTSPHDAYQ